MHRPASTSLDTVDSPAPDRQVLSAVTTPAEDVPVATAPVAFEDFYRDERDRLVRTLALHVGSVDLAAEAVDVAMSRAWQRWEELDDHGDAGAWVYRVARNWATSWHRRRRRIARVDLPDRGVPGEQGRVDDADQLAPALASLSDKLHEVVVLRLHAGFSVAETATALGVPEGTVKSRLARALDSLRTSLEDHR